MSLHADTSGSLKPENLTTEPDGSRRQFLKESTLAGLGLTLMGGLAAAQGTPTPTANKTGQAGPDLYPGAVNAQGDYVLPPLPYPYNALEPHIDELTMRLHHDKHHQAYVDGLNANNKSIAQSMQSGDYALIEHYLRKASFNGGGHFLHCIFWASMAPTASKPSAELQQAITRDFGSQATFEALFTSAAKSVEGNGWGLLCWSIPARRLVVMQTQNHNLLTQWANVPLLVVDVWEHAYYKKYSNDRGDYLKAFMNVINWADVSARYEILRQSLA